MDVRALADRLRDRFPDIAVARGEVTVTVDAEEVVAALTFLRDEPELAHTPIEMTHFGSIIWS